MLNLRKKTLLIITLFGMSFSGATFAKKAIKEVRSQEGVRTLRAKIEISPMKMVINADDPKKNSTVTGEILVTNKGDKGRFRLVFRDYNVDNKGKLILQDFKSNNKNEKYGLFSYLKYDSTSFEVGKGETKKVPFVIELPKDAIGTKYAHYYVEEARDEINYVESPETKKNKRKSTVGMELKVIGLLVVDIINSGAKTVKLTHEFNQPLKRHVVKVENTGDHIIQNATGHYIILDKDNKMVEKLGLKSSDAPINPGQYQMFSTVASKKYPKGDYSMIINISAETGRFIYTEKTTFTVSDEKASAKKKK